MFYKQISLDEYSIRSGTTTVLHRAISWVNNRPALRVPYKLDTGPMTDLSLIDFTELSTFLEGDKFEDKKIITNYGRKNTWKDNIFQIEFYSKCPSNTSISARNKWEYNLSGFSSEPLEFIKEREGCSGANLISNRHMIITKDKDEYFYIYYSCFDLRRGGTRVFYIADQIDGLIEFLTDHMFHQDFPEDKFITPSYIDFHYPIIQTFDIVSNPGFTQSYMIIP